VIIGETPVVDFEYKVLVELPANNSRVVYFPNEGSGVGSDGIMVKACPVIGAISIAEFIY